MSEVIDKIVQVQQAEMDEEVANDQVRRLTGQILEDLVGPIHLASKVVLQNLGSTARWLDHAVDTELERRVEIRSDYLEKDEDEEPDGFLSAIRAEMTRRGKATELRNGQLWTKQDGPQLDRLEDMCDVHRQGEDLWDIAERLTGLGLEVGLLPDEEDARNGTIMLGFHRRGDWFTCFLYGDDAIEAAVSTKTPEPYNAFLVSPLTKPAMNWGHALRTIAASSDSSMSIQRGGRTDGCIPATKPGHASGIPPDSSMTPFSDNSV